MGALHYIWILLFCAFFAVIAAKVISTDDTEWGKLCPMECECKITSSSQILFSRWKHENTTVKTAFCVFRHNSLDTALFLPNDTEAVTFLQATDGRPVWVSSKVLANLKNIKSIDMQGSLSNATTHLTNDVFHELRDLKYLSLQRIDMTGAEKAFSKLSSLEVLYVIYCNIGYLKWEMLDGLTNLKELYLVQSGIKELYGFAFYGTPELRRLFLSHNDLFSVGADAFIGLLKLEHLDLSNNHIDHLSGLTFPPLPHLQWLELKHNPIKVIFPHCFQFLNGTQHLTMGHKHQTVHLMKFSFRGLYSLKFLHIPNIDNDVLIEHMFYDLQSLQHLNLQGRVQMINGRAFNGAHKLLKKLILHDCKLERINEESFYGLENLTLLDLSSNLLRSIPNGAFQHLKSVQELLLHDNKLRTLPHDIFFPTTNLQVLRMYKNSWNCSCTMRFWNYEKIMAKKSEKQEICTESQNVTCSAVQVIEQENVDFTPRCENPQNYSGESVFKVLELLECETLNRTF